MPDTTAPQTQRTDSTTPQLLSEDEIIRLVSERAKNYYADGQFSCAEAMLKAFAEVFAPHLVDPATITRLATPFNGGFSELQQTCGVLTSGIMSIGMIAGRDQPGDEYAKEKAYTLTQIFYKRYMEAIGTPSCKELLLRWKDQGPEKTQCKEHTRRISELLARTILQVGFHDLPVEDNE
ncbi:MAG: C_GCAxxG_C_C family protein [Magnetococcales bacterium]|nr:C_GCAxxG_C_C family protein [Magnetococcales bacterium]